MRQQSTVMHRVCVTATETSKRLLICSISFCNLLSFHRLHPSREVITRFTLRLQGWPNCDTAQKSSSINARAACNHESKAKSEGTVQHLDPVAVSVVAANALQLHVPHVPRPVEARAQVQLQLGPNQAQVRENHHSRVNEGLSLSRAKFRSEESIVRARRPPGARLVEAKRCQSGELELCFCSSQV
jgi:hypothetical protein